MQPEHMPEITPLRVDTLLVSDIHLGSAVSRANDLLAQLKRHSFRRLILLGDVFDNLNFKRLRDDHWELLSYIRDLTEPEVAVEVVWILGNHDAPLENFSPFIGAEGTAEFLWDHGGKKYLAIHGHQFDSFLRRNKIFSTTAAYLFLTVQRFSGANQKFPRFLKKMSKGWLRLSKQVGQKAMAYAHTKGATVVFCGHTHKAIQFDSGPVRYFNTGSSTDIPASYITISEDGIVTTHTY